MPRDPVIVARVARAHGIGGGLLLDSETDRPEALFQAGRRLLIVGAPDDAPGSIRLSSARPHAGRWLVTVEGIADRTAAEALRGADLAVPRSELPDLEDDGYLLGELVGLTVVEGGSPIGEVREVYDLPAGPMLAVDVDGHERLVPFDAGFVTGVDVAAGEIRVELPEGLLDL